MPRSPRPALLLLLAAAGCALGCGGGDAQPPDANLGDMLVVPGQTYLMGCDDTVATDCLADETPARRVTLARHAIDRNEVTQADYEACRTAGSCDPPLCIDSPYWNPAALADHPAVCITYTGATQYCAFRGKRLPTEAEWEQAARSTSGTGRYPWGNDAPACVRVNFAACTGATAVVGYAPAGRSAIDALDMAGNVREWASDWYSATYYVDGALDNPPGPAAGTEHVLRGGSFLDDAASTRLRVVGRDHAAQFVSENDVGFRCALTL